MTGAGDTRNTVSIVDAIYKIKENGISFAVVLEPKKQQCILRTASNEFKFCVDNFLYTELYPLLPTETDRKVNVCGFYVVCDDRSPTSCGITDAIKNRYSYTNCGEAPIPPSSLEWGDKQIQYFKGSDL